MNARFGGESAAASAPIALDAAQRAVLDLPDGVSASVLGAPGSGKTATIVELVASRLDRGWTSRELLVLCASRAEATRLRDRLALRVPSPTDGPLARTVASFAFELVSAAARAAGAPPVRLVTGGEQDADIAALLEGQTEAGDADAGELAASGRRRPAWPAPLDADVRAMRGFRSELRELMARATEYDISPARLAELGAATGRPEWVAAAAFVEDYLEVVSSSRPTQLDTAELARFAIAQIERRAPDDRVTDLRMVIVDDLQEATESTLAILRALAARGVAVVAFGDPDVAANAFRGGEPDALGMLASRLGLSELRGPAEVRELVLDRVHRHPPVIRELVSAITARIGAAAAGRQRRAVAEGAHAEEAAAEDDGAPPLARIEAPSPAREWAGIARVLREEHLRRGVPWGRLAVIVRSGATAPALARALALAEVPSRTSGGGVSLRTEPAARGLLAVIELGIGRVALDPDTAADLLLGPFGGLDPIALRRLRLALRAEELAGGGDRPSGELLVESLSAPGRLATIDARPARIAGRMAETLQLLRESAGTIEDLLWIGWERSRLAEPWREQALAGGVLAEEANRRLDGVVALFTAAKRFSERVPDGTPDQFLAEILDAEVAEDVLTPDRRVDAVLVTTPSGAVGLEFDTVVVAALQDGIWPNLRPRGSLLHPQQLVRALRGEGGADGDTIDDRKLVLDDELRMFALAVSRARRRVVLSSVANDDESPSAFLSLLPDGTPTLDTGSAAPLSLRGMTGRLRRIATDPAASGRARADAAASLRELARLGIPGADPAGWQGIEPISSTGPLYEGQVVRVSPSKVETIEESSLDWFLETIAGGDSGIVANVGTILHWAMETTAEPSVERLWDAVRSRWGELIFDSDWLAERQSRLARGFTEALAEYLDDFARAGKRLVAAEHAFELRYETEGVDGILVRGTIDRVEIDGDRAVQIVDLKTGRPMSKQKVESLAQLGVYQLAYAEGTVDEPLVDEVEHRAGGAKLLHPRDGTGGRRYKEAEQPLLDDTGLEEVRDRIRAVARTIAQAQFTGRAELPQFGGRSTTPRLRLHRVKAVSSD